MAFKVKQSFDKVNMDLSEYKLEKDMAQFMKNLTKNVNQNPNASAGVGANMDVFTPLEGNVQLPFTLPDGINYRNGFYSSEQTNEGYFFIYNNNQEHTTWVINGDDGTIRKVYEGALLPFIMSPEYFISDGRCTLELRSYIDPATGIATNFKFLIFTNNLEQQYCISVEDSINTNSFTTPAPYFAGAGIFYDPSTLIHLGVPTPISNIGIAPVAVIPDDAKKQNLIVRQGFQFRVKFIDVYGRESEHGIISDDYISIVGGGCIADSNGMPRCVDISFDAGNPLVDTIQIEYRTWKGNDTGAALETGWIKTDTIYKWINAIGQRWYERAPNTTYYDTGTNKITYRFCADKNNIPIPEEETSRTQPGLAINSGTVGSLNKLIYLGNNVHGFQPIDPAEIAKVVYVPVIPSDTPCAIPLIRTIIVYANIYRPYNDASGIIRKSNDKIVWGNEDGDCAGSTGNSFRADQVFGDQDNPGFIFYLAGTSYACIAQWGELDLATGTFYPQPDYPGTFTYEPMMQIKFSVPAAKYQLEAASHKAKLSDGDYQQTSTYVAGFVTLNAAFSSVTGPYARRNYAGNPIKEIEIDCTAGDVIYKNAPDPMFVILDLSGSNGYAVDGYLYEQEGNDIPVEMAPVNFTSILGGDTYGSFFTDRKGFFFGVSNITTLILQIYADICDGNGALLRKEIRNHDTHIKHGDGTGDATGPCTFGGIGNWKNRVYVTSGAYPSTGRRRINQTVLDCSGSNGIPNMPVIMTKTGVNITDLNGKTTIIAHNRYNYNAISFAYPLPFLSTLLPNYGSSPNADDKLIFTQRGTCRWTACGVCTPSMADAAVVYIACCSSTPTCRDTDMPNVAVDVAGIDVKGVQSGGRYGVGFSLFDKIGRHTFVQVSQGDAGFINMPNLNDAGYQKFLLSQIGYTIDPAFTVPSIFQKMTFWITVNTAYSDFFSWDADYVQFVDNTGQTNNVNPTQIRIYYGSLNEYNKQNNYTTNCGWQFIATGPDNQGAPIIGDVVQFIMNGNGSWFPPGIFATVTNDLAGFFFTIPFRSELSGLTNGALFKVIRPQVSQTNYLYYEQSLVLDIVDGQVPTDQLTGVIPYTDSYILSRQLPVPILQGQPGAIPPGGTPVNPLQYTSTNLNASLNDQGTATNNANNSNFVLVKSVNDAATSFPFYFESPSPSDFWGSHLASRGRISTVNPSEAQQRIDTEIALSAALGDRSTYNGLSYFSTDNTFVFDRNTWGGIVSILVQINRCLVICENDHFFIDYNTTNLKVTIDGTVNALNQNGPFTNPSRPSGTAFGCSFQDIGTIKKYVGKVVWLDRSGFLVFNDFIKSVDVSTSDPASGIAGGYSGYLKNKIAAVNILNQNGANGITYFTGGIDPKNYEYYLTSFTLNNNPSYANFLPYADLISNETKIIDLNSGILKGDAAFTPEGYGMIPSYFSGPNFMTFNKGTVWLHHHGALPVDTQPPYALFYGTQTPCYVVPVVNVDSEVVKRYLWLEIYTRNSLFVSQNQLRSPLFYCSQITTEKGQQSRLLPARFLIRDDFQSAEFLCDLLTPFDPNSPIATGVNKLTDGNPLIGKWNRLTIKTNDSWLGQYFEFVAIITGVNNIKISGDK